MSLELPTPRSCVKSHLNDKPTCCLPLRPQSRHSDLWYFGAQLLSLQPCCLRLAHYITVTHSRLASNAVVSSLFDRISTCRIARPSLDARSGTNVVGLIPHFYMARKNPVLLNKILCQCPLGLIPHFYGRISRRYHNH